MRRVVILQEYIPTYRVPFFEALRARAAKEQIDLVVACGRPNETQELRGDSSTVGFVRYLRQRELSVLGRRIVYRRVAETIRGADLVILEQARRNLDSYWLLGAARRRTTQVALWGHGRDYTRPTKSVDRFIQRWLTLRADWFFAYTMGGIRAVVSDGFPENRTTLVQNSIDTRALGRNLADISDATVEAFETEFDLKGTTALFLGALDDSKRLPFLVGAAKRCSQEDPDFRLIIAGDGPLKPDVERWALEYPWLTYLGKVDGEVKALALATSQALAIPGRVGLVAVDSFAAGVPIVTTNWPWHAPEFEYLQDGSNSVISDDSVEAYSRSLLLTLADTGLLTKLREGCSHARESITVEKMVENFFEGMSSVLAGRQP